MLVAFAFASAQSFEVRSNNRPVRYGDTVTANIVDGECSYIFSFWYTGSGRIQTVIETELQNESNISVVSICAGTSCFGGAATNPFSVEDGIEYENSHVEFLIPENPIPALFKVRIYCTEDETINQVFYIKVLDPNVGINGELKTENGELSIYPNPASSMVTVDFKGERMMPTSKAPLELQILSADLTIVNMAGQVVKQYKAHEDVQSFTGASDPAPITFSVADLPKGVYNVMLGSGVSKKLVVK